MKSNMHTNNTTVV